MDPCMRILQAPISYPFYLEDSEDVNCCPALEAALLNTYQYGHHFPLPSTDKSPDRAHQEKLLKL